MNSNFTHLMSAAKTALEREYKDYCGGYLSVILHLADGATSVRYLDVQSVLIEVIKANRAAANQLNDYFDSDAALANSLIDYLLDSIKAA